MFRLVAQKGMGKWDEGEELKFDESILDKGVLSPEVRESTKTRYTFIYFHY